ncbi:MAG: GFA family protein [Alphaproteobacteria bacterium]|nr:GFA family protein [Alphaproteobacteria bacterium]MBU1513861.1 GFA family protein [Alphaproteobacteria bacterium]MBU2094494.1 GFA family protein [Alphaproteobacteria bacterium]MBU2149780.1 GFA family protein [Alphaproteobacteria bacterium]MBU2307251.1 GFA family protein [Alphaproteobacteria bacterium]
MSELPWVGGCRCGQVRFRVTAGPLVTMACHCTGCQRMTASAFSLSALFAAEAFEVTAGEPVIGGLHGEDVRHFFCPHCMSWMFTRPSAIPQFVNVRSTLFDDGVDGLEPYAETFTSEKLAWVTTPAVESYPAFPPAEAWGGLMAGYAGRG